MVENRYYVVAIGFQFLHFLTNNCKSLSLTGSKKLCDESFLNVERSSTSFDYKKERVKRTRSEDYKKKDVERQRIRRNEECE